MSTIYEVAKLAGVSLATVSRVTNKNPRVSNKTRQKVVDAMNTLGYRPNAIAQSLASSCSNSVGILVSELHGAFFGEMMAGIESELREAGKHVIITTGHSEEEKEKQGIEFLLQRNCDALIIHVEAVNDDYLKQLCQGDIPVYIVSRYVDGLNENCISLDNELGGYLATEQVIQQGHKDIAYIAGQQFKPDAKDRVAGHKRALNRYNIPFNKRLFYVGDFYEIGGYNGMKHFIEQQEKFTSIVCANDEIASGVMDYAREQGINLPDELSIVGFDNSIFAQYLYPKLTTINNPVGEMGRMAAKLVLRNVYQQRIPTITFAFQPSVVSRNSITKVNV